MTDKKIFISHRSTDKEIADILLDFFAATGIPTDSIFCSSLPGNDVKNKISEEIRLNIKCSAINLIIISSEYYQSAYCLNEEGVIWFQDTPIIVIAKPEIQPDNMLGFIRDEYKLRRLDSEDDIAAIYDQITNLFSTDVKSVSSITHQIKKLKARYLSHINIPTSGEIVNSKLDVGLDDITTDDEKVVLYYLKSQRIRKIQDEILNEWVTQNELYGINVANALDLLDAAGWGILKKEGSSTSFELDILKFRAFDKYSDDQDAVLQKAVNEHCHLSKDQFITMWDEKQFNDCDLMFISYIIDENTSSFGSRWMAKGEIENIKSWEKKLDLDDTLSESYDSCLNKFINNNLVYASSWTSYGNPKEYTLHKSLKSFLFNGNFSHLDILDISKENHRYEFPF